MTPLLRLCDVVRLAIPALPPDPIEHAERTVQLPGSARSRQFRCSISPWIEQPIRRATRCLETRIVTFVKPVQSGGSVAGEVTLMDWIQFGYGILQYNWTDDKKAMERWDSRIEKILRANSIIGPMIERLPRFEAVKGEIDFGRLFFRMQGVLESKNLDSDSVPLQINEEVHTWEPGHLAKARNRQTAVTLPKAFDISNAGKKGDQLNQAFLDGTQQHWEVKCPGCGLFHRMRTRWEEKQPQLGGLRYDSKESRREDGSFDMVKLKASIRFQMPCGCVVRDNPSERRALSLSGRYCEPTNLSADLAHRSYTYEAVTVDYISWLTLIKEKQDALRARAWGDLEPWRRYLTERECLPYDPDDVPIAGKITLSTETKKNRDGLMLVHKDPLRLFALDRQQGTAARGEFPHWWLVIRDVAIANDALVSLLVYEGKVETDEQVIAILDDHKCDRWHGVADSGDDTTHVYLFCLRYGINAIKGGTEQWYTHKATPSRAEAKRIYSVEKPLHAFINRDSMFEYQQTVDGQIPDPREPLFWLYSKVGIQERLYWLRAETKWEVPGDVSEDYQSHMEAVERVTRKHPRTGEPITEYNYLKSRFDLQVCEAYIAMLIEQAGLVREQPTGKENT